MLISRNLPGAHSYGKALSKAPSFLSHSLDIDSHVNTLFRTPAGAAGVAGVANEVMIPYPRQLAFPTHRANRQ